MRPAVIFAAIAAAVCGVFVAPAGVAAAQPTSPYEVINELEAQGYTVNIDRVGNRPIGECIVTGVRNPQTVTQLIRVRDGKFDWDWIEVIISRSISVSLDCT